MNTHTDKFLTALALGGLAAFSASAKDLNWTGGSVTNGQWNINGWANFGGTSLASGDDIFFGATNTNGWTLTSIGGDRNIASLTYQTGSPAYDIRLRSAPTGTSTDRDLTFISGNTGITVEAGDNSPHTIGLEGGSVVLAGDLAVTHNGSGLLTIDRPITGGFGLTKSGTGTLRLDGANSYTGATQVDDGILVFARTPAKAAGNVTAGPSGIIGLGVGASGFYGTSDVLALFNDNTLTGFTLDAASDVALDTTGGDLTLTTAQPLTGSRSLIKLGDGDLWLQGNNTYTGDTVISDGALLLGNFGSAGQLHPSGTITIAEGGNLNLRTGTSMVQGVDFSSSPITGGGTFSKGGSGTAVLNAANAYTGTTFLNDGILRLDSVDALPAASTLALGSVLGLASGDFTRAEGTADGEFYWNSSPGGGFAAYGSDRTVNVGSLSWGSTSLNTRDLILSAPDADATLIWSSLLSFAGSPRIVQVRDGSAVVDARISGRLTGGGSSGLVKTGAGTLELSNAANDYVGTTSIDEGVLLLSDDDALPGGIGATGGTGALLLNGGVLGLGDGNFNRTVGGAAGQVQWGGKAGFAAYGADRTVNVGTINWSTTIGGSTLLLGSADADATVDWVSTLSFGGTTRAVQVDDGPAAIDARFSAQLTGGGSSGLVKTGAGTLELTSTFNNYGGATIVSAGTLKVGASGVLPNTTPVTVGAAALDGADGVTETAGTLAVTDVATINIGSGASLIFSDSSTIDWSGGTLDITGDFVSGSSLKFGISAGGLTAGQLLQITVNGGGGPFSLDADGYLIEAAGYSSWAATNAPNTDPDEDEDGDGVANGVEYVVGGLASTKDLSKLPGISTPGGNMVFTFTRDQDSVDGTTTVEIEVGTDLENWPNVYTVGDTTGNSTGGVTVVDNANGTDTITLTLARDTDMKFARLRVTVP